MTSTAIAAAVATPPSVVPSVAFRSSVPAAASLRSVDSPGDNVGAGGGRLLRRKEFLAEANRTTSLKTLSCDLSEILVKNLSLKRSETSERRSQPPADDVTVEEYSGVIGPPTNGGSGGGGGLVGVCGAQSANNSASYGSANSRHSLCDTFTSVNKFIKLKRVSSDGSNLSRFSSVVAASAGGGANYTRIVEQPAKQPAPAFKRVEISVRERTPNQKGGASVVSRCVGAPGSTSGELPLSESDENDDDGAGGECGEEHPVLSVRKGGVIVNQLDQVDETCPLLAGGGGSEAGDGRAPTITLRKKDTALVFTRKKCDDRASLPLPEEPVSKVVLRRRVRLGDWTSTVRAEKVNVEVKRRSLQWPIGGRTAVEVPEGDGLGHRRRSGGGVGDSSNGSRFRHSWNAPGYDILEEDPVGGGGGERGEGDLGKNFASIIHNLAGLRNHHLANGTHESVSLLEQHSPQIVPSRASRPTSLVGTAGAGSRRSGPASWIHSSPMVPTSGSAAGGVVDGGNAESSPHAGSVLSGGPVPRKRRFEAFLKNLVGRRPSKEPPPPAAPPPPPAPSLLLPSPEIKISKSPSEHNLAEITRSRLNISTTSLSSVHQKLWSVVPLLKRDVSCASLASPKTTPLLLDTSQVSSSGARCGPSGRGSCGSGGGGNGGASGGMRKCETVLALTGSSSSSASQTLEPIRPLNRLRNCASVATCSRCSSLLSLAAAGSRYSLNASNGAFVSVSGPSDTPPDPEGLPAKPKKAHDPTGSSGGGGSGSKRKHVGNLLRLTTTSCSSSSSSSAASSPCSSSTPSSSSSSSSSSPSPSPTTPNNGPASPASKAALLLPSPTLLIPVSPITTGPSTTTATTTTALTPTVKFTCKLCLGEYSAENLTRITQCACSFCTECMTAYVEFEISEGAYEVSCPDAQCPAQGILTIAEITALASSSLVEKHHRYRLNREVELDRFRTWCPKAGCETICLVGPAAAEQQQQQKNQTNQTSASASCSDRIVPLSPSSTSMPSPCAVHCPTCREDFCSGCKKTWHPAMSCEENSRRLAVDGQADALGIPFDNDLIKCCPMCTVPIEKDEGCAQMMCKRCKHVFCWYCLASLDDDFLLRHYDKGPCKNKLGHSRASVVWHRAQVIGIFAGFGILLLVASPLLLLAAPCIVCCKCRICSGAAKLEETEVDYDDVAVALHSGNHQR
ncbi:mediator of RNA polymerase II transcription subunit 1 [Anopheles ziemanni]|uniref:mediator of RNA polymerase II transcription subunit 1 n=1 Tax=Anopheles coustani TaxID=139045 RepID=UPI00265B33FE|nr:mediator of RNA polymerase II transcription subunit 1 [Anopheles coustani]XP_058125765.1 mediator of RNA polymerase II transcription subunit 1 [Anopheles coustani]XP_058125767.1 mediator of RNA polymerase II transcription subunit 1 [Anopheles coustani]XP_058166568.1 mediator of RNA polymerase II transcription subunit 1 [Anopheles ziemanni]